MRLALGSFLVASSLALSAALAPTTVVEAWALDVFPRWASVTAWAFERATVSVTSVLFVLVTLAIALAVAWAPRRRRLRRAVLLVVTVASSFGATFVAAWGAAYYRAPLADLLDLDPGGADVASLEAALARVVGVVHAAAPATPLATRTASARAATIAEAARCAADADEWVTGRRVPAPTGVRLLPEGSALRAGYGGITLPWLLEPHVDAALPGAAFVATALHEITHALGWAREADTDALAVLAGLACDDADVRYATALHAVRLLAVAIAAATDADDPARARAAAAIGAMPAVAHADRLALADAVTRHRDPLTAVAVTRVYDTYLRTQGVAAGVADYGLAGGVVAVALSRCGTGARAGAAPWCADQSAAVAAGNGPRLRTIIASTSGSRPMKARNSSMASSASPRASTVSAKARPVVRENSPSRAKRPNASASSTSAHL
jgi:hypothetical protein